MKTYFQVLALTITVISLSAFSGHSIYAQSAQTNRVNENPITPTLQQNYPNPFNPSTTIPYYLPESATVKLEVFNLLGKRIRLLVSERKEAGRHTVTFDGSTESSGIYIYRLTVGGEVISTKKLTLLK